VGFFSDVAEPALCAMNLQGSLQGLYEEISKVTKDKKEDATVEVTIHEYMLGRSSGVYYKQDTGELRGKCKSALRLAKHASQGGLIGAIVGVVVTVIAIAAAPFTGGASTAILPWGTSLIGGALVGAAFGSLIAYDVSVIGGFNVIDVYLAKLDATFIKFGDGEKLPEDLDVASGYTYEIYISKDDTTGETFVDNRGQIGKIS